jgi:hypothetical protein
MRTLFVFLSAFIVIFLIYTLFIITTTQKNAEHPSISENAETTTPMKIKMSIDQIDSISAFENYSFTVGNYYKDAAYTKSQYLKSKKI